MSDERSLLMRHLEIAHQELGALIDSMDSMGDLGRWLPDLQRIADHMEADLTSLRDELTK